MYATPVASPIIRHQPPLRLGQRASSPDCVLILSSAHPVWSGGRLRASAVARTRGSPYLGARSGRPVLPPVGALRLAEKPGSVQAWCAIRYVTARPRRPVTTSRRVTCAPFHRHGRQLVATSQPRFPLSIAARPALGLPRAGSRRCNLPLIRCAQRVHPTRASHAPPLRKEVAPLGRLTGSPPTDTTIVALPRSSAPRRRAARSDGRPTPTSRPTSLGQPTTHSHGRGGCALRGPLGACLR